MSTDGSLVFDTGIDKSGFENGIKGLTTAAAAAAATVTAAFSAAAIAASKVGISFEASMSQVAATMGINSLDSSYTLLSNAAKEMGAATQFSATQAGEALNYLALAGYDAQKSVAALPTVLNVAAAGGIDLAYASDMITDSMSALGLGINELEGFSDKLAKTSQKSNTSVAQLGEAILTVGGTAKSLSGGVTELNTMLGLIADNGIKGAEGGTALRNIILSLSAPTDTAAKAMKRLNVNAFDGAGRMRSLSDVFADFNTSLSALTQQQKTQALNEIFNKVDLKAVNALLGTSAERFAELSGYISDCDGAAAQMAETMNDNLKGDITTFNSALEGLGIAAYEKFSSPMRSAMQEITASIGKATEAVNGDLAEPLSELAESLSDIAVEAAEFAVSDGLPLLVDSLQWIADNREELLEAAKAGVAMTAAYKGLTAIGNITGLVQSFTTAAAGAAAAQTALNAAVLAFPYVAIGTALIGGTVLLSDWIDKEREMIGYEGDVKEAYNDANAEIAKRIGYLSELNETDPFEAYKASVEGLDTTNKQLEDNNKKLMELYNRRQQINLERDNIHTWGDPRMTDLNNKLDLVEQEIAGIEEQNIYLESLRIAQEHIADQYDSAAMRAQEAAERYKQNVIDQNASGRTTQDIISDIMKNRVMNGLPTEIPTDQKDPLSDMFSVQATSDKLADEWKRLNHEYAIGVIATEKELYSKKSEAFNSYGNSSLENHWKYYEELTQYRESFANEDIERTKNRLNKNLSNVKSSLNEALSEYKETYSKIESEKNSYEQRLLSVGDIFTVSKEKDQNGQTIKKYTIENIQEQIEEMKRYDKLIRDLKSKGASSEMLADLNSLGMEDAAEMGNFLLNEDNFSDIAAAYDEKRKLAKQLAAEMYSEDVENLNTSFTEKVDSALNGLPERARTAGINTLNALLDGMDISNADLSGTVNSFINSFSEQYSEAVANMDLGSGLSNSLLSTDTYSIGKELAASFNQGFADTLSTSVMLEQQQFAQSVPAAPVYSQGAKEARSTETIQLNANISTDVMLDYEKLGKAVYSYIQKIERRKGG